MSPAEHSEQQGAEIPIGPQYVCFIVFCNGISVYMKPKFKFAAIGYAAVALFFLNYGLLETIKEGDTSGIWFHGFIVLFCGLMTYGYISLYRNEKRTYQQKLSIIRAHPLFAEPDEETISADLKTAIALNAKARKILLVNKNNQTMVCEPRDVVDCKLTVNTSTSSVTRGEVNFFWKWIGRASGKTWTEESTTGERVTLQVRTNDLEIPVLDIVLLAKGGQSTDSYSFTNAMEVGTEWENTLRVFKAHGQR